MKISDRYEVLDAALNVMVKGPTPLEGALQMAPVFAGLSASLSVDQLLKHLKAADPNDPIRNRIRKSLVAWDYDLASEWTGNTARNTDERRQQIYSRLALQTRFRQFLDRDLPFARQEPLIVVSEKFERWYSEDRRRSSHFYWSSYRKYLENVRELEAENLELLDEATNAVVERLTNPEQEEIYQSKGLVVGYVQSGKTMNFAGVIAKALDAGYRLIIVLSGTMDLLRNQTQRRLDMELVGKEQIQAHTDDRFDYDDDPDWEQRFQSYGGRPSEMGAFDILRLTGAGQIKGSTGDYKSLERGIQTLEFEKVIKNRPLYDPSNLHSAAARLMIVKKNSSRLGKLVGDLKKIGANALSDVPALIIDDESDQASINTIAPDKTFQAQERRKRSAINRHISSLLDLLPRAQYVGYTATPFANVFVDADDSKDIFPKDFILSLPRPESYMGAKDFHEIIRDGELPTREAHVHGIWKSHKQSFDQLERAIDTFVLTGAIKIYRERRNVRGNFRHHTMLVHESQWQDDHLKLGKTIDKLWGAAGYDGGAGLDRLRRILREDIIPVSDAAGNSKSTPASIEMIRSELGEAVRRIEDGGRPVLIVNGTQEADTPDFDKIPIWKIVLGGAKLSRGYTVEGLTVSYFRRRATYQDTLMQMGRWFGFRPGYRDLVRLFIGRHEPLTPAERKFIDLYEAFESICADEEEFRQQLERYVLPEDGSEPITPMQIHPLVMNSNPQLRPTAKSKSFNSELKAKNIGGEWIEKLLCSDLERDLSANAELFSTLLTGMELTFNDFRLQKEDKEVAAPGFAGIIDHAAMLEALSKYRWAQPNASTLLALELEFLSGESSIGDPEIDDWILYLPQVGSQRLPWQVGSHTFATVERSRVDSSGRFKAFSEPRHRLVAEVLTSVKAGTLMDSSARDLAADAKRGALLLYPTYPFARDEPDWPEIPVMGLAILPPKNTHKKRWDWGLKDPSRPSDPIVDN